MTGDLQILISQVDNGTVMNVRRIAEGGKLQPIEKRVYNNTDDLLERLRELLETPAEEQDT